MRGCAVTTRIIVGDCVEQLRLLETESIQTCVTSPPYWGLRDYGHPEQLGLERTPYEYVENLVAVFREVRRVLRDDGTLWLNLGDCYATGAGKVGEHPGGGEQGARWRGDVDRVRDDKRGYRGERLVNTNGGDVARPKTNGRGSRAGHEGKHAYGEGGVGVGPMTQPNRMPIEGLKPKDLVGVPWRVALALQSDAWYLRSDIIWSKPNPMPESVTDRPTKAHEYLFLLSKSERYLYDSEAIKEPASSADEAQWDPGTDGLGGADRQTGRSTRRFAKSGNKERKPGSARGCPAGTGANVCGSVPWEGVKRNKRSVWTVATQPFKGAHFATFPPALIEPCILAGSRRGDTILDPFGGAGTTGLVAERLGRHATLIELNPDYAELARQRIAHDAPLFASVHLADSDNKSPVNSAADLGAERAISHG